MSRAVPPTRNSWTLRWRFEPFRRHELPPDLLPPASLTGNSRPCRRAASAQAERSGRGRRPPSRRRPPAYSAGPRPVLRGSATPPRRSSAGAGVAQRQVARESRDRRACAESVTSVNGSPLRSVRARSRSIIRCSSGGECNPHHSSRKGSDANFRAAPRILARGIAVLSNHPVVNQSRPCRVTCAYFSASAWLANSASRRLSRRLHFVIASGKASPARASGVC